ncbi:MAG: ubiquitin-conjugating enzyme E2 [Promethearchaeota archaeon]|jgi:ubiquitin-protein ligase
MPELPIEIWKDRINNELTNLKNLNVIEEDSIEWHENDVVMTFCLKAIGFILKANEEPFEVTPLKTHQIFLKINRSFPYPGGIDFTWQSNIFHPNIHPVELTSSKEAGTGYICLNVLKQWSRLSDLESTIKALRKLVENPNPDDPLKYDVCLKSADFFKKNPMDMLKERYDLEELEEEKDDEKILVIDD